MPTMNINTKTALIHVETLIGSGHMRIVSHLSRALQNRGVDVYVLSSKGSQGKGSDFDFGLTKFIDLPNLFRDAASGKSFLTHNNVHYLDDLGFQQERFASIADAMDRIKPDIFLTETWPLGKGFWDKELLPVLDKVNGTPWVSPYIATIARDVTCYPNHRQWLSDEGNANEAVRIINEYFDDVIVTGDHRFIELEDSFPKASQIKTPIYYAGYFASETLDRAEMPQSEREVVVSSGSGYKQDCFKYYSAAIHARQLSSFSQNPWRILVSHDCPEDDMIKLQGIASQMEDPNSIIIERNRPDFRQLIANAAATISFGGRNTTTEVLGVKQKYDVPVLIYPRASDKLDVAEQQLRTIKLADMGVLGMLTEEDLDEPAEFAARLDQTARITSGTYLRVDMNGADAAADIIVKGADYKLATQRSMNYRTALFPRALKR